MFNVGLLRFVSLGLQTAGVVMLSAQVHQCVYLYVNLKGGSPV